MNKTTTHRSIKGPHLFVIAALLGGLALALGVVLLAQAAPATALQFDPPVPTTLTLLPDQATNTLPADTSHQFTALVLSQYGLGMKDVQVSFSTDSGQFQGDGRYVEVATDLAGQATVTSSSTTVGTAHIHAWIDGNSNNTYDTGEELTDDPSTKTWQEAEYPDFGDAPDSYGTLSVTIGARHIITPLHHLGLTVDGEPDGQPSPNANGDDLNASPDEDGVALQPILVPGTTATVLVNGGPSGGKLDAWIDFNDNKSFDHPGEHLFSGTSWALTPGVNPPLSFTVPATATKGITTCARFRLSINGGLPPTGPAPDGEVEDYVVLIQELPEGSGTIVLQKTTDPPDGATFSFASNIFGQVSFTLNHSITLSFTVPALTYTITEIPLFGWSLSNFDCETDGSESTWSWSDNTVTIGLGAGETITCTLTNSGWGTISLHKVTDPPGGVDFGFLSDFDFLRPPEFPLDPGFRLDHCTTLSFTIPAFTYTFTETLPVDAEWHLAGVDCETDDLNDTSSLSGNPITIDLDAGETISCTINNGLYGAIVLRKRTVPPGGTAFEFTDPFGIGLPSLRIKDGDTLTIPYVPAGTFSVTEADPAPFGLDLIDVDCEDPDGGSSIDLDARTATIDLDAGETITCTFTNGVPPEPVGGIVVPVNRLGLVLPWLGLAAVVSLVALGVTLVRRRRS